MNTQRYAMRETATHVYFYGGPLSQWAAADFKESLIRGGPIFPFNCAEQYMMAAKANLFGDTQTFHQIMESTYPKHQKELGRTVRGFEVTAWNNIVPEVLVQGNLAKFRSNPKLLTYLLSTVGKRLVEGSPTDRIYGVGLSYDDAKIEDEANWRGRNLLGNALEVVREQLTLE